MFTCSYVSVDLSELPLCGCMFKQLYGLMGSVAVLAIIITYCEYLLEFSSAHLSPQIPGIHYLIVSAPGIMLDIILSFILYIEYRLHDDNIGEFYFSVAFLTNAVYLLVSAAIYIYAVISSSDNVFFSISSGFVSVVYFFRQFSFILMTFIAISIIRYHFFCRLNGVVRYFSLAILLLLFIFAFFLFFCKHDLLPGSNGISVWSPDSLYVLTGLWFVVFLATARTCEMKDECRELLLFLALSGVVCNLMMAAADDNNMYPWYLGCAIDILCVLIVAVILFNRMMGHITMASNTLHRDPVTGVYNRSYFHRNIKTVLSAQTDNVNRVLIMCNIRNLRAINATRGSEFGDYVLKNIADVLLMYADSSDIVARTGSNSFVLLLQDTGDSTDIITIHSRIQSSIGYAAKNMGVSLDTYISFLQLKECCANPDQVLIELELASKG